MSNLTKAQLRVIELLYRGARIRRGFSIAHNENVWFHIGTMKRISSAVVNRLCSIPLTIRHHEAEYSELRLTETGRQLARERFGKDSE